MEPEILAGKATGCGAAVLDVSDGIASGLLHTPYICTFLSEQVMVD